MSQTTTEPAAAPAPEMPTDAAATAAAIAGFVAQFDKPNVNARTMLLSAAFWEGVVANLFGMVPPPEEVTEPPAPTTTLVSLEPNTAVVGTDDLVMHATGTGFTAESKIIFNGGEEPTEFVPETEVTTVVDPATASGPVTVPVLVRTGTEETAPLDFTFIAAP